MKRPRRIWYFKKQEKYETLEKDQNKQDELQSSKVFYEENLKKVMDSNVKEEDRIAFERSKLLIDFREQKKVLLARNQELKTQFEGLKDVLRRETSFAEKANNQSIQFLKERQKAIEDKQRSVE